MSRQPLFKPGSKIQDHYSLMCFWLGANLEFTTERWNELLKLNGRAQELGPLTALCKKGLVKRVKQGVYMITEKPYAG